MDTTSNIFKTSKTTLQNGERFFLYSNNCCNIYSSTMQTYTAEEDSLHTHPYHEIFILLKGRTNYLVEGTVFPLESGDTVLISAGDPHSKLKTTEEISILVIELSREFFNANTCTQYEKIFTSHLSTDHKISSKTAKESGIYSIYQKILRYCTDDVEYAAPAINALLIELLYLFSRSEFSKNYISTPQVQQAIDYINVNYTKKITLDSIAEEMFISKYHLCTIFKKHTGDTVKSYITKKRLAKVQQLTANGYSISKACIHAGFSDYSTFYKAFFKVNGTPPKYVLK